MAQPTPVPVSTVCSECGLAWDRHGAEPTLQTCVNLLKEELKRKPGPTTSVVPGISWPHPWRNDTPAFWTTPLSSTRAPKTAPLRVRVSS